MKSLASRADRFVSRAVLLYASLVCAASAQTAVHSDKILYAFTGGADGGRPYGELLLDAKGNLFGTTSIGGNSGLCNGDTTCGTVFELSPGLSGWTEKTIYSFTGLSDGCCSQAGLIMDRSGNLYGTAEGGGDGYCGSVFELTPDSNDGWTETSLYDFKGDSQNDGCSPNGTLTLDVHGNLYGGTYTGGAQNNGTLFELSPPTQPDGAWSESVLWSFEDTIGFGNVGSTPVGKLVFGSDGGLYGATYNGGSFGSGTAFKLTFSSGVWSANTIFSFSGGDNGCGPNGGVIFDTSGHLYGTTSYCGADNEGTIFSLTPTIGQWTMKVIHTFTGATDGGQSESGSVMDSKGNLYGTASLGGLFAEGTVFKLAPQNAHWIISAYGFRRGSDGAIPNATPTLGKTVLYGTTGWGGASDMGTVYQINLNEF